MPDLLPGNNHDSYEVLRKRWLSRYMSIQTKTDTKIRTLLVGAAEDAQKQVSALEKSSTFSSGVRSAQLRLVIKEVSGILNDVFGEITPLVLDGQKQEALAAVDGLTETDRNYLEAALDSTGAVRDFVDSQKTQAKIQLINAVNSVTKSNHTLSARVYRTKAISLGWVKKDVTSGIARGASAQEIAKTVRKHIRPNTPGGVSYAALRLARTELNNAFHATTITLSQDRPWIQSMGWYLSTVHTHDPNHVEICERYAQQTFPIDNVPSKPHPQCRCFVAPILESVDAFISHLTAGQYRDWIDNAA